MKSPRRFFPSRCSATRQPQKISGAKGRPLLELLLLSFQHLPVPVTLPAALRLPPPAVSSASQSAPPSYATSQATAADTSSQICSSARTPLPQLLPSDPPASARAPPPRSAAASASPPLSVGDSRPDSRRRAAQLIIFCQTATVRLVQASLGSFVASTSLSCLPPL